MREWIAFPVITAHLPLPYFWLCCSETLDDGQTHPPFLLSHSWPLSFCKFLNHPKVSQLQFQTCSLCPPFTCLQGCCPSLSPDPFEQRTALLKCKLNNNSSVSANMLLLSQSVSVPCSCPSYQFHILKLKQNTWAPHLRKPQTAGK